MYNYGNNYGGKYDNRIHVDTTGLTPDERIELADAVIAKGCVIRKQAIEDKRRGAGLILGIAIGVLLSGCVMVNSAGNMIEKSYEGSESWEPTTSMHGELEDPEESFVDEEEPISKGSR